jgi:hypothetical protein
MLRTGVGMQERVGCGSEVGDFKAERRKSHGGGVSIIDRNGKAVKVSGPMTEFDIEGN